MTSPIRISPRRAASTSLAVATLAILALTGLVPAASGAGADTAALYKEKCNSCHGPDGSGSTPIGKSLKSGDLRSPAIQAKTDAQLTESISKGKGKMQAFGKKLSPAEIATVVAYVRTLATPKA